MKKMIFGIFAHPDDEAFGPAGTLLAEIEAGAEVHLILLTAGEAGRNPDGAASLTEVRLAEWRAAGQLLGARSQRFLGYKDGRLNNQDLEAIGYQIIDHVSGIVGTDEAAIELMSIDTNGITGHIDHIVAGRAAAWAFYRLKARDDRVTKLRLSCSPIEAMPEPNVDWLFAEAGRTPDEIDETVDARQHHNKIVSIMKAHHSQRQDCQSHLDNRRDDIGINYFLVKT